MPSDARIETALAATAESRARYRAAVAAAAEQIDAYLDARRARREDLGAVVRAELGAFANGRIDAARFAAVVGGPEALSIEATTIIERALAALRELLARDDSLFVLDLPTGGELRQAVHDAIAQAGRAFGAVLAVQAVKGRTAGESPARLLDAFPFAQWNRSERLLAPPLIVTLEGADLHAEALGGLLDGQEKILLLPRGVVTPAPLARLVTPGVFVMQTADASALARAAAFAGPAIAALVPEACAQFVHDPAAGGTLRERLVVTHVPTDAPRTAVGGRSVAQQRDELAQLAMLAELATSPPAAAPAPTSTSMSAANAGAPIAPIAPIAPPVATAAAPAAAAGGAAAVDALAAWLLAQAGLPASGAARP